MYVDPTWKVVTIGDGDLSFSNALLCRHASISLVPTVLDSYVELAEKYTGPANIALQASGISPVYGFDVCRPETWPSKVLNWADLVIFQFPLVPASWRPPHWQSFACNSKQNLLNRVLLRLFLKHSFRYLLSSRGARLAYITSKDVKPYTDWNLAGSVTTNLAVRCKGTAAFTQADFPGYRIRNVDRNKWVKQTAATTYVYSDKPTKLTLSTPKVLQAEHCALCGKGPFLRDEERSRHEGSKRHQQLLAFEQDWLKYLALNHD